MEESHPKIYDSILKKLPKRIPGISEAGSVDFKDRIILWFRDENFQNPFMAKFVSDGTIKMFAYMVLLHDPDPHPLLCIEEPENYLHPQLLPDLAEEIRDYSEKGGQVFVSTHSPDFVNELSIEELFILSKKKGITEVERADENKMMKDLYDANNQLGWLWRNRYMTAANLENE